MACSDNNGNIRRETVTTPGLTATATQDYSYDALNRLTSASEGANWSRTRSMA